MRKLLVSFITCFLAAGCASSLLRPPAAIAPASPEAGHGELRVSVRWPYQAQAIPLSAATLDVFLLSGSTTVATASIARPQSVGSLKKIAAGSYTVSIEARRNDSAKTLVADGSASVTVVANRVAQAALTLVPKNSPRLDYIDPSTGPANAPIYLYGANLAPPPGGTYSVLVDGRAVPTALLQPGNSFIVLTQLPDWAEVVSSLSVSVDGIPIPDSQARMYTKQVIDHIAISPSSATVSRNASQSFTATAYADAAETQVVSGLSFTWLLEDQVPMPDPAQGFEPYTLSEGLFTSKDSTGSATVRVEAGGKAATASVVVN